MRKRTLGLVESPVQGHSAAKSWGQDPNPGLQESLSPHFGTASSTEAEESSGVRRQGRTGAVHHLGARRLKAPPDPLS